jgi:energy-coupling factor transporter ATPase
MPPDQILNRNIPLDVYKPERTIQALIRVEHLHYDHVSPNGSRITAIRGVNLEIQKGELVALVGANGSGKSTLARHFNALHIPTRGRVWVKNLDTSLVPNHAAIRASVGMVFQNPEDQMIASVVEEEVAFGMENLGIPRLEMLRRIRAVLKEYNLWKERKRPPHLLSSGQIQRLALAGVLVMQPECILFDETTAMLDPVGRQTVMHSIHEMHARGLTILYITHAMEEAAQAARVIVMEKGRIALDDTPQRVFRNRARIEALGLELPLANSLARRLSRCLPQVPKSIIAETELLDSLPAYTTKKRKQIDRSESGSLPCDPALIKIHNLKHDYLTGTPLQHRSLKGISLNVQKGEVHALLGPTGSGKSTLLQHINGLYRPQSGTIRVDRYDLNDPDLNMQLLRSMVGLVFQNPDMQLFEQYVGDEIAFGPKQAGLTGSELRERVRQAMETVGLGFKTYKDRFTIGLSGGERKKVTLASALALNPHILLLDEPLAGLDPQSRKDLLISLNNMVESGLTLILSSHNIDEITQLASHASLVHEGTLTASGEATLIFSQPQLFEQAGLVAPLASRLAGRLRTLGWPLPAGIYSETDLCSALESLSGGKA